MSGSCGLTILASIIIGAIFTILVAVGSIELTSVLFWIIFGISVLLLVLVFLALVFSGNEKTQKCIGRRILCLLLGTIGGIVFSFIVLAFAGLSTVAIIIFTFLAITSFFIELISFAGVIRCLATRMCN